MTSAYWSHLNERREADMGDSISLLLMALLSLQSGPAEGASSQAAAQRPEARCTVASRADETQERVQLCRMAPDGSRVVRVKLRAPQKIEQADASETATR